MKILRCLFAAALLSVAVLIQPAVFSGCSTQSRQVFTTIHSVATAIDIAEREYLDLILAGRISTNSFQVVQAGYGDFQGVLKIVLSASQGNTNAQPPSALTVAGAGFLSEVAKAKSIKIKEVK